MNVLFINYLIIPNCLKVLSYTKIQSCIDRLNHFKEENCGGGGAGASLVEGAINEICVKKRSRPRYFRHRIIGDEVSKYRGEGSRAVGWSERERVLGGGEGVYSLYLHAGN